MRALSNPTASRTAARPNGVSRRPLSGPGLHGSLCAEMTTDGHPPSMDLATFRRVYEEARRIAHHVLQKSRRDSWSTSILVNEAFVRLLGGQWAKRVSSEPNTIVPVLRRTMETALIDAKRRKLSAKRPLGEARKQVFYDDGLSAFDDDPSIFYDILRVVDELRTGSVDQLKVSDRKKFAEAVELGFVLGCSAREIAAALDVPQTTVSRWLRFGKAVVAQALEES